MARPLNDRPALTGAEQLAGLAAPAAGQAAGRPDAGWRRLANTALLPAAGAGPDWLGAMLEDLGSRAHPLIARSDEAITGLMAVECKGLEAGYPATIAASWHTDLTFAGTPLVARADAAGALAGLVRAAGAELGARALLIAGSEADAALMAAVAEAAGRLGVDWRLIASHERAALRPAGASYETWLEKNFSTKKRKEFRRIKARLAATGDLAFESLEPGEAVAPWVDDFIALERAGWKGRRGTAVGCDEALTAMLHKGLGRLAARGDLGFWKLSLDNHPAAMLFAPMAGERAWLLKIAHDEALARFSPGVLIILEATRELMAAGRFSLIDSCAMPGHWLIEHLWRERIAIADFMIATPGTPQWLFALVVAAERGRRAVRAAGKRTFYALTGRRVK